MLHRRPKHLQLPTPALQRCKRRVVQVVQRKPYVKPPAARNAAHRSTAPELNACNGPLPWEAAAGPHRRSRNGDTSRPRCISRGTNPTISAAAVFTRSSTSSRYSAVTAVSWSSNISHGTSHRFASSSPKLYAAASPGFAGSARNSPVKPSGAACATGELSHTATSTCPAQCASSACSAGLSLGAMPYSTTTASTRTSDPAFPTAHPGTHDLTSLAHRQSRLVRWVLPQAHVPAYLALP